MQKECKFCKKQIEYNKKQYYASHVSNCKENPKRSKIRTSSIQYELSCKKCKTNYSVKITKNAFEKGKFTNYCSQSCANSRGPRSVEVKEKIRQSAKVSEKKKLTQIRKNAIYKEKQSIREVFEKECLYCKAAFFTYKIHESFVNKIVVVNTMVKFKDLRIAI